MGLVSSPSSEKSVESSSVCRRLVCPPWIVRPRVYEEEGVTERKNGIQSGLTLVTSWWEGVKQVRLIDQTGRTLHKWEAPGSKLIPDSLNPSSVPEDRVLHGTYLFPNGDLLVNVEYTGTARLSSCGEVLWRMSEANHHSIDRADDGSFWIPAHDTDPEPPPRFPGLGEVNSLEQILRVTGDGEIVDRINALEILYSNGLERFLGRYGRGTHLNDVDALPDSLADEYPFFRGGDLAVSLRDVNLVFVFDPESGEVKWHTDRPFIRQHDPDFIGDGWIGIFDNRKEPKKGGRGEMLGGSRIVAIQPHTDSTRALFPTEKSDPFYTGIRGKWQMLRNGNMLLTESEAGRAVEVAPSGKTVWEWIHEPHSENKVPAVTKAARHEDLTREDVASWPCSSVDSVSTSAQNSKKAP